MPDDATRSEALEISVRDRYDVLAGSVTWRIDRQGMGKVRYDYVHMHTTTCTPSHARL